MSVRFVHNFDYFVANTVLKSNGVRTLIASRLGIVDNVADLILDCVNPIGSMV